MDTLADVLVSVLLSIHKIDDNFLPRISRKSGRVRPILAVCHEDRRSKRRYVTVREMKEGPSGSAIRS